MPWFKGNLHCHSSRSDGRALPVNVGRFYHLQGHDFIPHMIRTAFGGRAFNVVKTATLTCKNVVDAVRNGRFYASTGVLLDDYGVTKTGMALRLRQQQQERTVFQFFGSGGRELQRTVGGEAQYDFKGDEGYVRVRIGSTCGVWA